MLIQNDAECHILYIYILTLTNSAFNEPRVVQLRSGEEDYYDSSSGAWDVEGLQDDLKLAQALDSVDIALHTLAFVTIFMLYTPFLLGKSVLLEVTCF